MPWRNWSLIALALLLGARMWLKMSPAFAPVPLWAWIAAAIAAVVLVSPRIRNITSTFVAKAQHPTLRRRAQAAAVIAIISSLYLSYTAHRQDRDFFPKTLDDQSYAIQMQMLVRGRLWMPEHPCADFFDTFHVLVTPKYASAYFPGTALLYTPLIWTKLPLWIGPIIVAGAIVGLVYLIVTELVDGIAGAIAALVMISPNWFRMLSILIYGQTVSLMLGLLMFWAWLRWRESQRRKSALLIGVLAGFMAITRPADAICYALPIAVMMICRSERSAGFQPVQQFWHGLKTRATYEAAALVIVGAMPFLAIQEIQNIGITGHLLQTPFSLYLDRDQPGANFGFHRFDLSFKPASIVPQKQIYYQQFIVPFIQKHTLGNTFGWLKEHLPQIADVTLPARIFLVFIPIGLLGLSRDARRWSLAATFPLFLLLYFGYPPFVEHYAVPFTPAVALIVAMAPGVLRKNLGDWAYLASIALIVIVSISMLPELSPKVSDETFNSPMMRVLHDQLDQYVHTPAVVLFRYHPELPQDGDNSYKIEPVYNADVAWPDDAPIIRAHDLGNRNIEIFRYYARIQPERTFYIFDRGNLADPLHELGNARQLAGESPVR